jgi:hypothetical protein
MSHNKFVAGDVKSEQQRGAESFVNMAQVKEMIAESEQNTAEMIERVKNEVLIEAREELANQMQTDKISLITIFGVFASMLTLITIEFKILNGSESIHEKLGFSLVLCSLLLCFPIALDYLVASRVNSIHNKMMAGEYTRLGVYVALVVALFAAGMWLLV